MKAVHLKFRSGCNMPNTTKQHAIFVFLVPLLALMLVTKALADENLKPPQLVIQSVSNKLQNKLQDKSFTNDFAQVTRFVDGVINVHTDFDRIAPLVLGKHWKTATTEERDRFKNEFRKQLVRVYSRAFIEYNDWTLRFQPLEMANEATKVVVKTHVLQPGQQPAEVNYRMYVNKGEWKVYDIIIEGVSLVTNYRSIYSDEIQRKGSLSALIDELAKRNAEALTAKKSS
jgi:phospholipid transport system substrate-binding protein